MKEFLGFGFIRFPNVRQVLQLGKVSKVVVSKKIHQLNVFDRLHQLAFRLSSSSISLTSLELEIKSHT